MSKPQENKKKNTDTKVTSAVKDLVIITVISISVFVLSYFFDLFVFIVRYLEKHPYKIIYIDEIITGLLTLSIAFAVFSWRRWIELKKEAAERIRTQEELVRIANTKAETERIISHQLRSEIDTRKQVGSHVAKIKKNRLHS